MADRKATKAAPKAEEPADGWTDFEKEAIKERIREMKATAGRGGKKADGEADVLAKIAEMSEPDRSMAERIHALVKGASPALESRTWYGMPAYAKDGKVICFFQAAQKFKARYATFGFSDDAILDDGAMWPTSFAIRELTPANEARIGELVRKAVG